MAKKKTTKNTKKGKYIIHDGEVKTYKEILENSEDSAFSINNSGLFISSKWVFIILENKEEIKYYGDFYATKKGAEKALMDMKDRDIKRLKEDLKDTNFELKRANIEKEHYKKMYYDAYEKVDGFALYGC